MARKKQKPFKRLPNGFGSIRKLSGKRRKPYMVTSPVVMYNNTPIPGSVLGYFETWEEGYERLVLYKANKEWEHRKTRDKLYTFKEVYEKYFHEKYELSLREYSRQAKDSSNAAFKNCAALHDKIFSELTYDDLQDNIDSYIGKLKHSSLELIKSLYNGMYKFAMKHNICNTDYAKYVEIRIPDDDEKGVPFTEEELKTLWKSDMPTAKIMIILCYSGWRISEFINIKIDMENLIFQGGMKTEAGKNRIVPIHPDILPYLEEYIKHPLLSDKEFRQSMYKTLTILGIERHTPHDCRHTFSWLCDKYHVDRTSKKFMLGHSQGKDVTDAVYGHRSLDQLKAELVKIKCY